MGVQGKKCIGLHQRDDLVRFLAGEQHGLMVVYIRAAGRPHRDEMV